MTRHSSIACIVYRSLRGLGWLSMIVGAFVAVFAICMATRETAQKVGGWWLFATGVAKIGLCAVVFCGVVMGLIWACDYAKRRC